MTPQTITLPLTIFEAEVLCVIDFDYQPHEPAAPTSAALYERTGDPGDPEVAEELEITMVRAWYEADKTRSAVNLTSILTNNPDAADYVHEAVLNHIHGED